MAQRKKASGLMAIVAIVGCIAILIIGIAVVFGGSLMKSYNPKNYVGKAFIKTVNDVKSSPERFSALYNEIVSGRWQQDFTLGVNQLSGDIFSGIDPSYLSFAEVVTIKTGTQMDKDAQIYNNNFSVQLAVSTLAEVNVYCDREQIAVNIPQAFDYFITVDPKKVVDDWDTSLLGRYFTPINSLTDNEAFYKGYMSVLFDEEQRLSQPEDYTRHNEMLIQDAEYKYLGREKAVTPNGEQDCDVFSMNLTEASLNAYWKAVGSDNVTGHSSFEDIYLPAGDTADKMRDIRFDGGMETKVYVYKDKIVGLRMACYPVYNGSRWEFSGYISLTGELANLDKADFDISLSDGSDVTKINAVSESRVGDSDRLFNKTSLSVESEKGTLFEPIELEWNLSWDKKTVSGDNFDFSIKGQSGGQSIDAGAAGSVTLDNANKRLECNFKKLYASVNTPESLMDVSFNLKYMLRADSGDIAYDKNNVRPLPGVNELDVWVMYEKIMSDPQLGMIMGNIF